MTRYVEDSGLEVFYLPMKVFFALSDDQVAVSVTDQYRIQTV